VIRQEIDPYKTNKRKKKRPKRVDIIRELSEHRCLFVEADVGGGKSKLLRRITQHFADVAMFTEEKTFPVYTTFKELVDEHGSDLRKLLTEKIPEEALEAVGQEAKYLFLIDAPKIHLLDE